MNVDSTDFQTATSFVNQASPTEIQEENLRAVRQIYLATYVDSIFEFTPTQHAILEAIACQYALEGGEGVYIARTLLGDDFECGFNDHKSMSQSNSTNKTSHNFVVDVYPNPANDKLYVSHYYKTAIISVVDISGKIVVNQTAHSKTSSISLIGLETGVYFVRVQGEKDDLIHHAKLIKL
jgi:hypothetical protein